MMSIQTLLGLSGISLLIAVIVLRLLLLLKSMQSNIKYAYLISLIIFSVSFVLFSGYSLNQYLRGVFNDLSISSLVIMLAFLVKPDMYISNDNKHPVLNLLALWGVIFYPAALGFGPFDPYAWGFINNEHGLYAPLLVIFLITVLMVFALLKKYFILLLCLSLSSLSFQLGMLESRNIWDYLFDPILIMFAIIVSLKQLFNTLFRRN